MLPKYHIALAFALALILRLFTSLDNIAIGVIFISAFLIDFDHYLLYFYKKRDFNLERAYDWFVEKREAYLSLNAGERRKYKKPIYILHGIEPMLIILALSMLSEFFIYIFAGLVFHLLVDLIEAAYLKEPLYFKLSQIWTAIKNKGKKDFFT